MGWIDAELVVGQACLVSRERSFNTVKWTMQVTPVRISRPAADKATRVTRCPRCDRELKWTVSSIAAVRRTRLWWLLLGLAGVVVFAGTVVSLATFGGDSLSGLIVLLMVLGVFGGFVATVVGLSCCLLEKGVRIEDGTRGLSRPHGLRPVPKSVRRAMANSDS